jgi:hypothetical protein
MARGQKLDTNQDRNAASDKQKIPDIYRVKAKLCYYSGSSQLNGIPIVIHKYLQRYKNKIIGGFV